MQNTINAKINNISFLAKISALLVSAVHLSYAILFYFIGVELAFEVKIVEFIVALFIGLLCLFIKRMQNFSVYFTHLSIFVSCVINNFILGDNYGFITIMILILSLGYVHTFKNNKWPIIVGGLEIVVIVISIVASNNLPSFMPQYEFLVHSYTILILTCVIVFYSTCTFDTKDNKVKELDNERSKLQNRLDYDYLTGLLNRHFMNNLLKDFFDKSKKNIQNSFALILCDIDNFHIINEEQGCSFGDIVLKNTADFLKDKLSGFSNAYISRWGGGEFLILINNISADESLQFAKRLCSEYALLLHKDGYNAKKTTMTFGAYSAKQVQDIDFVLSQTDAALIQGKKSGKNTVEFVKMEQN